MTSTPSGRAGWPCRYPRSRCRQSRYGGGWGGRSLTASLVVLIWVNHVTVDICLPYDAEGRQLYTSRQDRLECDLPILEYRTWYSLTPHIMDSASDFPPTLHDES